MNRLIFFTHQTHEKRVKQVVEEYMAEDLEMLEEFKNEAYDSFTNHAILGVIIAGHIPEGAEGNAEFTSSLSKLRGLRWEGIQSSLWEENHESWPSLGGRAHSGNSISHGIFRCRA